MPSKTWQHERRAALDILEAGTMTVAELLAFSPFPRSSLYALVSSAPFDVKKRRHDFNQKTWTEALAKYGVQASPTPMVIKSLRGGRVLSPEEAEDYRRQSQKPLTLTELEERAKNGGK